MSTSTILELRGISKRFENIQALQDVSFNLREGETHALVGENGAGKSTLMRILAGIYTEYDGEYLLDNQPLHLRSPREALSRGIGMIHQELSVMPELTVAENLFLGRQLTNRLGAVDWGRMNRIAAEELRKLGFADIDVKAPLGNYSLGTQQVVEVLRAILSGARVLIMDEPTTALSPPEVERLIQLIDTLRQSKRSIIYISHFLEEIMRVADRITVLRDGQRVDTLERRETSITHIISLILGREVNATLPAALSRADGQTLLSVSNLTADVFREVNLTVEQGEVVGLYGAIGAGHFDLARALFGLYRIDSGMVAVAGQNFPANFSAAYAIRHGLAYATESRRQSLFMTEPIYRNVMMPHLHRLGRLLAPQPRTELELAAPQITLTGVHPNDPLNPVGQLSGGNQQKVAIARWLPFPPKVFIMAEPTRGMDVGAKNEVLSILRDFRNQGYGVLVVSSEPETVLSVSDRIVVMSRGRVVSELLNQNIDKDVLMRLL
ncbi:MAG: sugar ABC transporter ATP-binding protein [Anaerolineae bacterium]|nr:sugar ABC transporter ATP-binding protein [Anaerolineae bacterium]